MLVWKYLPTSYAAVTAKFPWGVSKRQLLLLYLPLPPVWAATVPKGLLQPFHRACLFFCRTKQQSQICWGNAPEKVMSGSHCIFRSNAMVQPICQVVVSSILVEMWVHQIQVEGRPEALRLTQVYMPSPASCSNSHVQPVISAASLRPVGLPVSMPLSSLVHYWETNNNKALLFSIFWLKWVKFAHTVVPQESIKPASDFYTKHL